MDKDRQSEKDWEKVITKNSRRSVIVSRQFANLRHDLQKSLYVIFDCAVNQVFGNLEELFHDDSDALIAQQLA